MCHLLIHVECSANLLLIELKPCVVLSNKLGLNMKIGGEDVVSKLPPTVLLLVMYPSFLKPFLKGKILRSGE